MRRFLAAGCLSGLVLLAGGALVGLILAPEPVPVSLAPAPAATSAPVTYESFDDERQLPLELVPGPTGEVLLASSGTVTSLDCVAGDALTSGEVPLTIDAVPVAALYTAYPLWRDLRSGDEGPDVAAVQSELTRLGYAPGNGGKMNRATVAAVKAFFTDRGVAKPDGSLARSAIIWLPTPQVTIAGCNLHPADTVTGGDALVTTGGGLVALRPARQGGGQAPGIREVSFGGSSATADQDGVVTDPAFLAAVAASPEYALATTQAAQGTTPQMTFTSALATPLETAVVPPGSLYRVSGATGCIASGGVGHPVTIVSSRLGSTYVTIDDGSAPSTVDTQGPADRTGRASTCS